MSRHGATLPIPILRSCWRRPPILTRPKLSAGKRQGKIQREAVIPFQSVTKGNNVFSFVRILAFNRRDYGSGRGATRLRARKGHAESENVKGLSGSRSNFRLLGVECRTQSSRVDDATSSRILIQITQDPSQVGSVRIFFPQCSARRPRTHRQKAESHSKSDTSPTRFHVKRPLNLLRKPQDFRIEPDSSREVNGSSFGTRNSAWENGSDVRREFGRKPKLIYTWLFYL